MSEQNIQLALKRRGEHETEVHASESQTRKDSSSDEESCYALSRSEVHEPLSHAAGNRINIREDENRNSPRWSDTGLSTMWVKKVGVCHSERLSQRADMHIRGAMRCLKPDLVLRESEVYEAEAKHFLETFFDEALTRPWSNSRPKGIMRIATTVLEVSST